MMSKIFQNAARVLNAPLPLVYVQPDRSGRLLLANCIEGKRLTPTVIVGRDLMSGYRDTEVAVRGGEHMALLRPAYYLRLALPAVEELEAALGAAATVAGKQVSVKREIAAGGRRVRRRDAEAPDAGGGRDPARAGRRGSQRPNRSGPLAQLG